MTLVAHEKVLTFFDGMLSDLARWRFVEVVGEPGTGRTRLLREVCRRARLKGISAWYGRPDEPAFDVVDAADDHLVASALDGLAFQDAVRTVLTAHADTAGLLLVLDDMHSADESSVTLVTSLLRTPPRAPVLVVTASCPGQPLSVDFDTAVRDGTSCRVTLDPETPPCLETTRQAHPGDEEVSALLVAAARRVRDHFPTTAAECLRLALRLLPPDAIQDRLELQLELAATSPPKE